MSMYCPSMVFLASLGEIGGICLPRSTGQQGCVTLLGLWRAFVGTSGSLNCIMCWSCLAGGTWFNAIEVGRWGDKCKGGGAGRGIARLCVPYSYVEFLHVV